MHICHFLRAWPGPLAAALAFTLAAGGAAALLGPTRPSALSQATTSAGFTYQGRLNTTSGPVNATCDIKFELIDAASGGASLGSITRTVSVANGLFVTNLDFGGAPFTGAERWLELAARCGTEPGFTALTPRQELTPAPYALGLRPGALILAPDGSALTVSSNFKGAAFVAQNTDPISSGASAVLAISSSPNGAALEASPVLSTGIALQVNRGKIRVVGAAAPLGAANAPPAFQIQTGGPASQPNFVLNHPLLNNEPQALIFSTPYGDPSIVGQAGQLCQSAPAPLKAVYLAPNWVLVTAAGGNIPANGCYNILVIHP